MIWDPRMDSLDPLVCVGCGEVEVLKDTDRCLDCTLDDEMEQEEAAFWAAWAADCQAEEGAALVDALAGHPLFRGLR